MSRRISLVVTDLDGTFWDRTEAAHPRTLAAVGELERRGVPLLVATARRPGGARRLLAEQGVHVPGVFVDGALVRDSSWRTIHAVTFGRDLAAGILAAFRRHALEPCLSVVADDDRDARLGPNPSTHPDHLAYLADWAVDADLDQVVRTSHVQAFVVCGADRALLEPVAEAVSGIVPATLSPDPRYGDHTLMVRPPGVNKWEGVLAYCAAVGIDPEGVLAIGDGLNDIELLARAAVACAVEGSDPTVLALADHVVPGPGHGGWANLVELLR